MVHTILYVIWFLVPTAFFVMALWAKLEQMSGSPKKQDPMHIFRQGIFLLICVLICVGIETFFLTSIHAFFPSFIPLGFLQVMLLPVVLLLGAKLLGGSEQILIDSTGKSKPAAKTRRRK